MCLIVFAHDVGAHALVLAANRDEHHARPTEAAHAWRDAPHVFGGRDLEKGGTWLAVSRAGRLAAVTNVRTWPPARGPRSRGLLCADFVRASPRAGAAGDAPLDDYARSVAEVRAEYGGFNLLLHDGRAMRYVSDATPAPVLVPPGIHGLSNAALDVRWPKVARAEEALRDALELPVDAVIDALFAMLADRSKATDDRLPSTGVPLEIERDLSPIFIASSVYGTRASTVVVRRRDGVVIFEERSFGPDGVPLGVVRRALNDTPSSG
jgi:uncharacterized protein with NRDE domain